ncbi:uncharacterized protein LOC144640356, partial [Oculina patagonica]
MKTGIGFCSFFAFLNFIHYSAGAIKITSKYQGKTVTGLVGSSVNFTWSFTGSVDKVNWGLNLGDPANDLLSNGLLVSLRKSGPISVSIPQEYIGRVSGSRSGDASSGQAIFTLKSITKDDEKSFGCLLISENPFESNVLDLVHLFVE